VVEPAHQCRGGGIVEIVVTIIATKGQNISRFTRY
jgi:hypothetical protein